MNVTGHKSRNIYDYNNKDGDNSPSVNNHSSLAQKFKQQFEFSLVCSNSIINKGKRERTVYTSEEG